MREDISDLNDFSAFDIDEGADPTSIPPTSDAAPLYVSWGEFKMDANGLRMRKAASKNSEPPKDEQISSAFELLGACRDPFGRGWGKWLRWRDKDGRVHTMHVPDAKLVGDPAALCSGLLDRGLRVNPTQQKALLNYLAHVPTKTRVTLVSRTGWHTIGGHDVFVLPGQTIGSKGEAVILDETAQGPYEARGSLTDWQAGVGALVADHALGVLTVSAALAGTLLHIAGQEGGGLNLFGPSSKGKTTLSQAGASVWGRGGSPGYVRAWRATANGLEGAAASASDTCLVLDELGVIEARDAASAVYGLSNGYGKVRAGRDGSLREPKSWRVLTVSTGEVPVATKLSEDRGRRARGGQLVRLLDIPTDRGRGFGAFDHGGPEGDASALAKAIKQAATTAYGVAGPEFVRRLIAEGVSGEAVRAMVSDFVTAHLPTKADGQIDRAAQRLGLIMAAGELATAMGVTPWREGAARDAAAWALARWIEGRGGTEPDEVRQAIEAVRLIIETHGESRFEPLDGAGDARPVNNRLGWRIGSGEDARWLVPSEVWRSVFCDGLDPRFVAKALGERGMLERANDGWQIVRKIEGRSVRVFAIKASIFDGAE